MILRQWRNKLVEEAGQSDCLITEASVNILNTIISYLSGAEEGKRNETGAMKKFGNGTTVDLKRENVFLAKGRIEKLTKKDIRALKKKSRRSRK